MHIHFFISLTARWSASRRGFLHQLVLLPGLCQSVEASALSRSQAWAALAAAVNGSGMGLPDLV